MIDDKQLIKWSDDIQSACDIEKKTNENFHKYYGYVFDKCLTDGDVTNLKKVRKNTFDFSSLRPYIMHALKGMRDAQPTVSFKSVEDDDDDDIPNIPAEIVEDQLNIKLQQILDYSHFNNEVYNVSRDQCIGGKGIFKVYTDYSNNYNFDQSFYIKHVQDTSKIYFDPFAKDIIKSDARWCAEKIGIPENSFKEQFPNIPIESLENTGTKFNWLESSQDRQEKIINVIDYYFIKTEKETIYLSEDGEVTTFSENTISSRTIEKKRIWHIRFCGKHIIEKEKPTVFKQIPFVYVPSESYIDRQGNIKIVPYAKHGFDGMRSKNFILNYYLSAVLNNPVPTTRVDERALTAPLMDALRTPQDGKVQPYKATVLDKGSGQQIPTGGIIDVPSPPLPNELLQAATQMDTGLAAIFGTQFPSLNDLNNVSGKALYNLSQYMSASTEVLMQNMLKGIVQVANLINQGMPEILKEEQITYTDRETAQTTQVMFDYTYNPEKYRIVGQRGVSTRLQKEANLESLISLSQSIPEFAQFLSSPPVMQKLLEMMELTNEDRWIKLWEEFQTTQQENSEEVNPEVQQQAVENNIESEKSKAAVTNSKARMLIAETKAQELSHQIASDGIDKTLEANKIAAETNKNESQASLEVAKLNQKHTIDLLKLKQNEVQP